MQDRFTKDENATARTLFERAAELDPGFTRALFGLAWTHYNDLSYGWTDAPARSVAEIERLAKQCVALDESDPRCQMTLALAHHLAGRRDEALAALDFVLRIEPELCDGLRLARRRARGDGQARGSHRRPRDGDAPEPT